MRDARRARAPRRAVRLQRPAHRHLLGRGRPPRTSSVFDEVRAIRDGGGFGSIIGRNSFQRTQAGGAQVPRHRHGDLRRHPEVSVILAGDVGGTHTRARAVRAGWRGPRPRPRGHPAEPGVRLAGGGHRALSRGRAARGGGRGVRGHRGPGGRRPLRHDQPAVGDRRASARVRHSDRAGRACSTTWRRRPTACFAPAGEDELVPLQSGVPRRGNLAVIAAGTGLGEALVVWRAWRAARAPSSPPRADTRTSRRAASARTTCCATSARSSAVSPTSACCPDRGS